MPRSKILRITVITALLVAALAYSEKGIRTLAFGPAAGDLKMRWVEQQYVLNHQNPFDVYLAHSIFVPLSGMEHVRNGEGRNDAVDEQLGVPTPGYPPWFYCLGYLFLSSRSFDTVRVSFALLNAGCLGFLAAAAFRWGRLAGGAVGGMLLCVAVAATSSFCTTCGNGQFGVIVVAALVGAVLLEEAQRARGCRAESLMEPSRLPTKLGVVGRWTTGISGLKRCTWWDPWLFGAGLLAGVAASKPTIAGPFLCAYLVRTRWAGLAGIFAYMVVGSAVIWRATATDPAEMLLQMVRTSQVYLHDSYGPATALSAIGVPVGVANAITFIIGALAAVGLAIRYRDVPVLHLFGMLSVLARLWIYHKVYDNLSVVFLLIALGSLMLQGRGGRSVAGGFWAVGISLWLPAKVADLPVVQVLQIGAWVYGLIALCAVWSRGSRSSSAAVVA